MLSRAPVVLEKCFDVDDVAMLSGLGPKGMASLHLDLRVHLGNRRNISANSQCSERVRSEEITVILALGRRPGPVARLL